MEGSFAVGSSAGGSGEARPPNPLAGAYRRFLGGGSRGISPRKITTLVRHASMLATKQEISDELEKSRECHVDTKFVPIVRSGGWADIGFRKNMEDAYVCYDNFMQDFGLQVFEAESPNAFYAVFDGHGGKHAADFACSHLPRFIVEGDDFPLEIERVLAAAFLRTDVAFAEACSADAALASGTTALVALVVGRSLVVANAGDCRAVLCRRGKAIEMSRDHKPACVVEKMRIEASGGYVYDGYLNGQLNVARAIGDWHVEGMKGDYTDSGNRGGSVGPLSAEPEVMRIKLTEEDEFLIIGCDGIWDVFRSQNAVDFARRKLQVHNDPATCCRDLVDEALKRRSDDNLSVVVVCFSSRPPPDLRAPRTRGVQRSISAEGLRELQSFLDELATE